MAVDARPKGHVFELRTPYLSNGRTTSFLENGELMNVAVKVYASGGENALHAHTNNEHFHLVLEGQATFYDENGNTTVVNKNQGMFLPIGALYYFQSTGDTNLVLMSAYAHERNVGGEEGRKDAEGRPLPGHSEANKHIEGTPIPGKFFGD